MNNQVISCECPCCGDSSAFAFKNIGEWSLVKCQKCDLIRLNPQPTASYLTELYQSPQYFKSRVQKTPSPTQAQERSIGMVSQLGPLNSKLRSKGRLLEIGCGYGLFLAAAQRDGWDVTGVEISSHAAQFAKKTFELLIYNEPAESIQIDSLGKFDAVVMFSVIEHLHNPLEVLKIVKHCLNPGGVLWGVVPNAVSFDRFWHGEKWSGWDLPFHLWHFTPKTISRLLETAGFSRIQTENTFFDPVSHIRTGLKVGDLRADKRPWEVGVAETSSLSSVTKSMKSQSPSSLKKLVKKVMSERDMKIWAFC